MVEGVTFLHWVRPPASDFDFILRRRLRGIKEKITVSDIGLVQFSIFDIQMASQQNQPSVLHIKYLLIEHFYNFIFDRQAFVTYSGILALPIRFKVNQHLNVRISVY